MKTATLPSLRVDPELRQAAEALLKEGETLSGFVEEAVRRNVEYRRSQQAFIERGLAAWQAARDSGEYVAATAVLDKLTERVQRARTTGGATEPR
ncbi:MAG: prevent-host-death protein [Thiobacillaceae bacterium]|jgi:predicted transcriptional regulator|nr:prevent-host-death protein [Thiobacillaceae bacterium]